MNELHAQLTIPAEGWPPPWPLLLEVAQSSQANTWTLVGGMMVQIHTRLAGTDPHRTTNDIDLLLDLMPRQASVVSVVGDLTALGFTTQEPSWPNAPFHRLRRHDDVIDLLVPDHLPKHHHPRMLGRTIMPIDGGAQALTRLMNVDLLQGDLHTTITTPDLLGALVLKAAASVTDNLDPARHERDAALLASLITDHATQLTRLHGSDRRRLRALTTRLADPYHPAWVSLQDAQAQRGQDTLRILTS